MILTVWSGRVWWATFICSFTLYSRGRWSQSQQPSGEGGIQPVQTVTESHGGGQMHRTCRLTCCYIFLQLTLNTNPYLEGYHYFVGYCVLNQNRIDFPECKNLPLWKQEPDSGVCSRTEGSAGQVMKVRVTRSLIQQISDWRFHLLQQLQLRLWATENEEK